MVGSRPSSDPGSPAISLPTWLWRRPVVLSHPDITVAAARIQIARVAKARGMSEAALNRLVSSHVEDRQWGVLGQPRVNVLLLNLALDGIPYERYR